MVYERTVWKNREVEYPRRYIITDNGDGTITLEPSPGNIIEPGTPITADNMNNIEEGIILSLSQIGDINDDTLPDDLRGKPLTEQILYILQHTVKSVNGNTGEEIVIDVGDIPGLVSSFLTLGDSASAGAYAVALGGNASAGANSVAVGTAAAATGEGSVALGYATSAAEDGTIALGNNALATGFESVAIGTAASAGNFAVATGRIASAENYSVALGYGTSAATDSVALGRQALATGNESVAIGGNAWATKTGSAALGYGATADGTLSVAIGVDASATGNYSIALGHNVSVANANEGVLGGTGSTSTSKWRVPGSFTVSGTKNFEIPHPKPEKKATHVIRHSAVESPTPGDTLYRWKIQATKDNDIVTIDLPDYFVWLNKDVQIWVTGQGHFGNGYGVLNRETEQLEIHCQLAGEYNVLVIGTRNDDHPSVQEWDIKGVEREIGESWTGETCAFEVDEIMEIEEIKEVSA